MTAKAAAGLSRRTTLLYAAGSISGNAISQAWTLWLIYFYAPPADAETAARVSSLGPLDPRVALGAVLTAARLLEALDDPLLGYWSDRTRSRWGRRLPFIVLGTPWWGLLFVALFVPPAAGASSWNLAYLFGVALGFYFTSNISGAPLEALLPHVARSNADRVSVATWQVVFGVTGAIVGLSLSSLLQASFGFVAMAVVVALIAVAARALAVAGTWRIAKSDATPVSDPFAVSFTRTFANRQFLAFLPSFVTFQVGLQMLTALLPFYVVIVLSDESFLGLSGADDEGVLTFLLTVAVIGGMLAAVPAFARLARRRGKAFAYRVAMLGAAAWFPLLGVAGFVPGVPPLLQAVLAIFIAGLPTAGVYLFPNIITADVIDDDAGRTGARREAMYYGAQNLVEKLATALAPLLFALVLLAGDSAEDPLGVRLVGVVAASMVLLGWAAFRRYSLEPHG